MTILKIMDERKKIGAMGEEQACHFLECHGYQLLETNFRSGNGEIDIIAIKEDLLVFTEVKTLTRAFFEDPEESISWHQKQKILETSDRYLSAHEWEGEIRFDMIAVMLGEPTQIEHYQDTFNFD